MTGKPVFGKRALAVSLGNVFSFVTFFFWTESPIPTALEL